MLLADVVATSATVAATSKRTEKVAALAAMLRATAADESEIVVGFLVGWPRQGRIGVGWATVGNVRPLPVDSPTVSVREVDETLSTVAATSGGGSVGQRQQALGALLSRCTEAEQDFLRRLLLGEMRQGANEGVVTDAIAK